MKLFNIVCVNKLKYLIFSLFLFILMFPYVGFGRFLDESDNLIGGMVVHSGGRVYGEFYSQHTPIMYYITAVFASLGANTVEGYRLFFYILLIGCFWFIYFRYKRHFGVLPLLLYPLIYIFSISLDGLSHMILSEQVQAQAMVIIFLELILFCSVKSLKLDNKIVISVASFFAIGVAFVSVYVVAFIHVLIFIGLLMKEEGGVSLINKKLKHLFFEYSKIIFISALPFLIFFTFYVISGNMKNMYLQAFWLNTNVYSKYNGGFGVDPIAPVLNSFHHFFSSFVTVIFNKPDSWVDYFRVVLNKIAILAFIFIFSFKNKLLFFGVLFFVILNTIRGDWGFHAIQYWAITAMMIALIFNYLMVESRKLRFGWRQFVLFSLILCCSFVIVIPYVNRVYEILISPASELPAKELTYEFYANKLLAENEGFLTTSIQPNQICYVQSHRLPSTKTYVIVPWFTDVFEAEIIADLMKSKTKVVFHNPDNEVWGKVLKNYAPRLNEFILNNYQELDIPLRGVYVRKDFYDEALRKLLMINPDFFGVRIGLNIYKPEVPVGEISVGNVILQTFSSDGDNLRSISVLMATYMRKNLSTLKFSLLDASGLELFSREVNAENLLDNEFYKFEFPVVSNSGNKKFAIEISAISGAPGNSATAWMSKSDIYPDGVLTINGNLVEGDLSMKLIYDR